MIDCRTTDRTFADRSLKLVTSSLIVKLVLEALPKFPQLWFSFGHVSPRVPTPSLVTEPLTEGLPKPNITYFAPSSKSLVTEPLTKGKLNLLLLWHVPYVFVYRSLDRSVRDIFHTSTPLSIFQTLIFLLGYLIIHTCTYRVWSCYHIKTWFNKTLSNTPKICS